MATAEEILQANPEGHIVVGGDRFITVPKNLKRLAVQYDHNMETVTFDCPRYWDDQDMSKMVIYVNYTRSDGEGGTYSDRYPVGLPTVDANNDKIMHFNWTISRNVTEVAGPIVFLVCVQKTGVDENGKAIETNHWNSELCEDCYVSPGMETEETAFDMYPDETTDLIKRMLVVEAAKAEMESMLTDAQTAKGDAQTAQSDAEAARDEAEGHANDAEATLNSVLEKDADIRNNYANAIKGNVSGEAIRVDDVSPIGHDVKCRVHGKNLFNTSKLVTLEPSVSYAYVSDVGEDYLVITTEASYDGNGYCTVPVTLRDACPGLQLGKTYVLTANTESNSTNVYLPGIQKSWVFGTAKVITEDMLNSTLTFYGLSAREGFGTGDCRISNIQIEEGSVATDYEPYIDPSMLTLKQFGKNLLNPNRGGSSGKGLTLTNNGDGSFTITGTATSAASFGLTNLTTDPLCLHKGVTYTQSVIVLSGSMTGVAVVPSVKDYDGNVTWNYFSNNETKTPQKHYTFWGYEVYVENGKNVNLRFKVQLEVGKTATEYEPYKTVSTHVIAPDGTCVIPSVSPTMTLFTDTPGVTIEAEYNRDTTKMFESYVLTDKAKKEIADIINNRVLTDTERVEIANMVEEYMAEVLASLNSYAASLIDGGDA